MSKRSPVSNKRSLIKAITFRLLVVISDFLVIYFITHKIELTLGIIIITNIPRTALYFIHERIWNKVDLN